MTLLVSTSTVFLKTSIAAAKALQRHSRCGQ
jgi:hypothetical protein